MRIQLQAKHPHSVRLLFLLYAGIASTWWVAFSNRGAQILLPTIENTSAETENHAHVMIKYANASAAPRARMAFSLLLPEKPSPSNRGLYIINIIVNETFLIRAFTAHPQPVHPGVRARTGALPLRTALQGAGGPKFYLFFNPKISLVRAKKVNGKWQGALFSPNVPANERPKVDADGDIVTDAQGHTRCMSPSRWTNCRTMTGANIPTRPNDGASGGCRWRILQDCGHGGRVHGHHPAGASPTAMGVPLARRGNGCPSSAAGVLVPASWSHHHLYHGLLYSNGKGTSRWKNAHTGWSSHS